MMDTSSVTSAVAAADEDTLHRPCFSLQTHCRAVPRVCVRTRVHLCECACVYVRVCTFVHMCASTLQMRTCVHMRVYLCASEKIKEQVRVRALMHVGFLGVPTAPASERRPRHTMQTECSLFPRRGSPCAQGTGVETAAP